MQTQKLKDIKSLYENRNSRSVRKSDMDKLIENEKSKQIKSLDFNQEMSFVN